MGNSQLAKSLALFVASVAALSLVQASEGQNCPPPPKLTCDQLIQKAEERCPKGKLSDTFCGYDLVPKVAPCDDSEAFKDSFIHDYYYTDVPEKVIKGHWLFGGGPAYMDEWGISAAGGYELANAKWQFLGVVSYFDREVETGVASTVKHGHTVSIPWQGASPANWEFQALALYKF